MLTIRAADSTPGLAASSAACRHGLVPNSGDCHWLLTGVARDWLDITYSQDANTLFQEAAPWAAGCTPAAQQEALWFALETCRMAGLLLQPVIRFSP